MERMRFGKRVGDAAYSLITAAGFLADSFMVEPTAIPSLQLTVRAGVGFLDGSGDVPVNLDAGYGPIGNLNDQEIYKPCALSNLETLNVPAADPVNPRIDIVEVTYDRHFESLTSRDILDTGTGSFVATMVAKIMSFLQNGRSSVNGSPSLAKINYKTGTPAAVPVAATLTAGYTKIAEVYVPATATALGFDRIRDTRSLLGPQGLVKCEGRALINNSAAVAAQLVSLRGSPGIRAAVVQTLASPGAFTIYVAPGTNLSQVNALMQVQNDGNTTEHYIAKVEVLTAPYTLTLAEVTAIAAAAQTNPVQTFAEGMVVAKIEGRVQKLAGAGPIAPTAPAQVAFNITLSY
jgi:hypothetical protein